MIHETGKVSKEKELSADLGFISALSLVVGMVLGAGAFMKPPAVLAATGDTNWALAAWILGGVFSMAGGLTLCELGVLYPRTGGIFVYLEELYGAEVAFLYGWMLSVIFGPAVVGALTGYFSSVFCLLFDISAVYIGVVGASVLAFITFVNSIGVKQAGYLQTAATVCKLVPIILLTIAGLVKGNGQVAVVSGNTASTASFSVAVLATLFAYDGWAQVASVAGEIRNPSKILPRAIIGGLFFLVIVYISVNMALFKIFAVDQMIALGHDASSIAAQKMFGLIGGNLVAVGIMISILGGLNGYIMTLSRSIYIMGERGHILGASFLSKIDSDSSAPVNAMLMLVFLSYLYFRLLDADRLSNIAMFSIWLFYLLTFIGIFIARKKHPDLPRPYKVPLFPITPLLAIGGALYVIYGMLSNQLFNGIASIALTLGGLPLYYYQKNQNRAIWPRFKTQYIVALGSCLIIGMLTISVHIFDTREELKVGVEPAFAPFAYQDNKGQLSGFDIDLINSLADKTGVKVSYRASSLEHIFEAVNNDYVDAAVCSLSITPERNQSVIFSNPYIKNGGLALLVKKDAGISDFQHLTGKTVGVQQGSTSEAFTRQRGGLKLLTFQSNVDMIKSFNDGRLDAIVFDRLILNNFLAEKRIENAMIVQILQQEEYAIAFSKKNKPISEKFNKALDEMRNNGELDALYRKWFGADIDLTSTL